MAVKECCEKAENLEVRSEDQKDRPDIIVHRCKVCGCRHIMMEAAPGVFGLRGSGVGG